MSPKRAYRLRATRRPTLPVAGDVGARPRISAVPGPEPLCTGARAGNTPHHHHLVSQILALSGLSEEGTGRGERM